MADTNLITSATADYVAGTFSVAPLETTLPTNATSALDVAFVDLGNVGEDGYSYAITRDTEDINNLNGEAVYTIQNNYSEEITVTLIESSNADVLKLVYGDDNVTVAGSDITIKRNKNKLPRKSFCIDLLIDQGLARIVVPVGMVANIGDITYVHSDIIKYELTIKAYPDASGNYSYEYRAEDGS